MSSFIARRLRLARSLEIDRAVFFAIAGKIWSLGAGLVTTLLIAVFFAPDLQGYYYTFQAVLAIQAIAELGLGSVLTYYASHEWAKISLDRDGGVTGDSEPLTRFVRLLRVSLKWYLVASAIVTLVLATGGLLFFGTA